MYKSGYNHYLKHGMKLIIKTHTCHMNFWIINWIFTSHITEYLHIWAFQFYIIHTTFYLSHISDKNLLYISRFSPFHYKHFTKIFHQKAYYTHPLLSFTIFSTQILSFVLVMGTWQFQDFKTKFSLLKSLLKWFKLEPFSF